MKFCINFINSFSLALNNKFLLFFSQMDFHEPYGTYTISMHIKHKFLKIAVY